MEKIYPNLYLGNDDDGTKALEHQWYVLSVCKDGPNGHRSVLGYKTPGAPKDSNYLSVMDGDKHLALNIVDVNDPHFISDEAVNEGLRFIHKNINNKILVHCNQGQSRSPSIVMLYLRSIGELPLRFRDGFRIFKTLYPDYNPNQGMEQYTKTKYSQLSQQSELEKIYGK